MTPEEIRERVLDDVARIEYEDSIGKHGHSTPWTAAPEFVRASWRRRAGRLAGVIAKAVDAVEDVAALSARIDELEAQRPRIERRLGNVDALPPGSQIIDDDGTPEWITMGGIVDIPARPRTPKEVDR